MVKVDREAMVKSLREVAAVVDANNPVAALRRICFRDGIITGSNGVVTVMRGTDVQDAFCIDAASLLAVHAKLTTDEVDWDFKGEKLVVKSGSHRSTLVTAVASTFPNLLPSGTNVLCTTCIGLTMGVKRCLDFTREDKQSQLGGVCFYRDKIYSADEIECVRCTFAGNVSEKIMIPRSAAKMISTFGDPVKMSTAMNGSNLLLIYSDRVVLVRTLEPKMPVAAIDGMVSCGANYAPTSEDVAKMVMRVASILSHGGCVFSSEGGTLSVVAEEGSKGKSEESIAYSCPDFSCKANPDLFARAMREFESFDPSDACVGGKGLCLRFFDATSSYAMGLMT